MNILITGACGHIGSYLADNIYKIKKVKKIYLVDNLKNGRINTLFNSKKKNKLKFYLCDISLQNSLNFLKNIDVVIHLASLTNAAESFKIKKDMYRNNLNCFKNIINFCKKNKSKLVHISSTSVYGKQSDIVSEDSGNKFLKPQSPYADIKLIEEKILEKEKNLNFVTFRFGTIAGISKGMRFHTAVNKFCLNASLNKPIEIYKTALHQYRPYLSLRDSFKVFKFSIENNFFNNQIYNALSGNFTVNDIIKKIKKYKQRVKIKFVHSKIMNQLSYYVSSSKLKKSGLKLGNNLDKDIKETLQLLKNI
jgi:nucleoside-diphosphate-sugar epimerase